MPNTTKATTHLLGGTNIDRSENSTRDALVILFRHNSDCLQYEPPSPYPETQCLCSFHKPLLMSQIRISFFFILIYLHHFFFILWTWRHFYPFYLSFLNLLGVSYFRQKTSKLETSWLIHTKIPLCIYICMHRLIYIHNVFTLDINIQIYR